MKIQSALLFIILALGSLILTATIGLLIGFQSLIPDFLKDSFTFNTLRPLHVTTAVSWIILSVTGGIYYYIRNEIKVKIYSETLIWIHFLLFFISALAIFYSFFSGNVGGREYLSFSPYIMIPILISWAIFAFNFIKTTIKVKSYPVYLWMWTTGIIFMIYHLIESNFWIFTSVRGEFIRDFTIQWKSYGSFVGSWNLLVYGTAIFLMAKVKNDESYARSNTAFFFFFLGLTNLMLGWAHHTYLVPSEPWIRILSYITSMTEWIIIIKMIREFKKSMSEEEKTENCLTYRYLMATDKWVFANLVLALLISIPALNYFTHGTQITVAHSMGTTIGINTTILLASVFYVLKKEYGEDIAIKYPILRKSIVLFNLSLIGFLLSLFLMGLHRSDWMFNKVDDMPFGQMFDLSRIYLYPFLLSGFGLFASFVISSGVAIKLYMAKLQIQD